MRKERTSAVRGDPALTLALCISPPHFEGAGSGQAEPLFVRSVAIDTKALGPDHPRVAMGLDSLAGMYEEQGRYVEAEPLYRRALAVLERALGPDRAEVATPLNNLAALYRAQRRYAEAEPLFKRAISVAETALGPGHLTVAQMKGNLP